MQSMRKGTSSAKQVTATFWVKSNVTGTYIAELQDHDNIRHVSASYSISASATWEKKIITFPADTSGEFDNDSAVSLSLKFWLTAGSNFTTGALKTSWANTFNTDLAVGQTNVGASINNYWQITGVQLELGTVSTEFEFEQYDDTLLKCMRYYQALPVLDGYSGPTAFRYGTTQIFAHWNLGVPMRGITTLTHNITGWTTGAATLATISALNFPGAFWTTLTGALTIGGGGTDTRRGYIVLTAATSFTGSSGDAVQFYVGADVVWGLSSEL